MKLNPTNMSMREKLLELQEESLSKLELDINQQHTQYLPTLAYSEHNMIAHASSLTTVNCTKEKGRFLEVGISDSGNLKGFEHFLL